MAFNFSDIKKKVTQAGASAAQQTKNLAETAKINSHISDEEKQINSLYVKIGKSYFEDNKDNESAEYRESVIAIMDAQARIAQYKEQIAAIKGVRNCPNCGAEVANGAAFCNSCGARMAEQPVVQSSPVDTIICPQCGAQLAAGSRFCDNCGGSLEQFVQPVQTVSSVQIDGITPPTAPAEPVTQTEAAEPETAGTTTVEIL